VTQEEIRNRVLECLGKVAPEADLATLSPAVPFRDQLDIDSMDFLNFVIGLDEALHVAVPEADYGALTTLDDCVAYLTRQSERSGGSPAPERQ
jgi:acyl carrier protein